MRMRVTQWLPDHGYGFAISADEFNLCKAFVHQDNRVKAEKTIQIGSLIECDIERPKEGQQRRHLVAKNIKVLQ
jgi:hypothetical protein